MGSGMRVLIVTAAMLLAASPLLAEQATAPDFPGLGDLITGLPQSAGTGRDLYVKQIMAEAVRQHVPPALADAVAVIETASPSPTSHAPGNPAAAMSAAR